MAVSTPAGRTDSSLSSLEGRGHIGVLIDDLVTLSPKEPYRMFTSRAERLALRQDSADLRLTPLGISIGLVSEERREKFEERRNGIDEIRQLLSSRRIGNVDIQTMEALRPHLGESLELALRDPALGAIMDNSPSVRDFLSSLIPGAKEYPETWAQTALLEARYKGYLEKESRLAFRLDRSERLRIPPEFDYRAVPGLSKEAMEKLGAVKPLTLGQASRVTGVRKSDLALLYIVVSRQ